VKEPRRENGRYGGRGLGRGRSGFAFRLCHNAVTIGHRSVTCQKEILEVTLCKTPLTLCKTPSITHPSQVQHLNRKTDLLISGI